MLFIVTGDGFLLSPPWSYSNRTCQQTSFRGLGRRRTNKTVKPRSRTNSHRFRGRNSAAFCWRHPTEEGYKYYAHKFPILKKAYDFTLIDQDGKPLALHSLRGRFVLIDFGFTECPNICPTTLANLAAIYALLSPEEQARLQVLFITDRSRTRYSEGAQEICAIFRKVLYRTYGEAGQIDATARAYGVIEDETERKAGARDYVIAHSTVIFLIGPSGKCIGFYGNNDLRDNKRMAEDLRHFLELSPADNDNWESRKVGVVKPLPVSGRQLYLEQCASCHLENGRGIPGSIRRWSVPPG